MIVLGVAFVPAGPVTLDAAAGAVPYPPKGVTDVPPYWLVLRDSQLKGRHRDDIAIKTYHSCKK